ncbi:hypothetical protein NXT08_23820 (plasmid) [Rhodococcus pyridinivorans]|uniref:hypothetical protein n=1 Tax=Rhodococcus TaxID=1827 RepID=UPI0007DA0BEC|nr:MULTISPECIES: hypothetical protein [Rhodococcus]MCT7294242.1 hypothetical protein [Rhodococcus sp. PAE-6]QXU56512.1 hypothetical protein KXC42_25455 [Rhodococcus sp. LW-XY12]UQB75879.1 hypothetical protein KI427_27125 [Rhodococcus ruber]UVT27589.1 hypothetical protein NXT08_23820 [Rhodococcus pyridinivorans]WML66249.1 hypothetical protein QNA09_28580 [Rhodococcus sp. AH-ZY2]
MDVDAPEGFWDWLDRIEVKARGGDEHSRRILARAVDALKLLRDLPGPPDEDKPDLKRVRQLGRYPVWRTARPFDPGIAFRLICWFPPNSNTVVVALFAGDKSRIGDVFYNSVGPRADTAIRAWKFQAEEGDQ